MEIPDSSRFLSSVESRIRLLLAQPAKLRRGSRTLINAARHLCLGNEGKQIRPRLVVLLGHAAGAPLTDLEDIAAAAELIHGASLLHDDVVDAGDRRRGRPTANAVFGNAEAVLAGDWLLSAAFSLLTRHERAITTEAIAVVAEMSGAAVAELETRGRVDLAPSEWQEIAEGKTGSLFAWCATAAARLAGREDLTSSFAHFGRRLGIAFQLADDLKDLCGGEPGKDRFSDVKNRCPSLPILLALEKCEPLRQRLDAAWRVGALSTSEAHELGCRILETGAMESAAGRLQEEIAEAVRSLGSLAGGPWVEELLGLAQSFTRGLSPSQEVA